MLWKENSKIVIIFKDQRLQLNKEMGNKLKKREKIICKEEIGSHIKEVQVVIF